MYLVKMLLKLFISKVNAKLLKAAQEKGKQDYACLTLSRAHTHNNVLHKNVAKQKGYCFLILPWGKSSKMHIP